MSLIVRDVVGTNRQCFACALYSPAQERPDVELPSGPRFYDLRESSPFFQWDEDKLDGLSLHVYGFPSANSVPVRAHGRHIENFIGTAYFDSEYLKERNLSSSWKGLADVSPDKDFLFDYPAVGEGFLPPRGFSGSGVWVGSDGPEKLWISRPILLGVCHRYFDRLELIAATKLPALFLGFIQIVDTLGGT